MIVFIFNFIMTSPVVLGEEQIPELDKEIEQLREEKKKKVEYGNELAQTLLTISRRNESIEEELQIKLKELQGTLVETEKLYEKTKEECDEDLRIKQQEILADFKETEKILIEHRKNFNYLTFSLNEKREVDETRKQLIAKQERLTKQLHDVKRDLKRTHDSFEREQYTFRQQKKDESHAQLAQAIKDAKEMIKKEQYITLQQAERDSDDLSKQVFRSQKVVASLRDQYNHLLEEANELEMQMTESKLVTQLTTPEADNAKIAKLKEEHARLEDAKLKQKAIPEVESRRKLTQHLNMMKRKRNELSGFMKLNALKHEEMEQLRALAMTVIEQRQTLMAFFNETLSELRKEVANIINTTNQMSGNSKRRVNSLAVSHSTKEDEEMLGPSFSSGGEAASELKNYLQYFELLYSRFTGAPMPKISQPHSEEEDA